MVDTDTGNRFRYRPDSSGSLSGSLSGSNHRRLDRTWMVDTDTENRFRYRPDSSGSLSVWPSGSNDAPDPAALSHLGALQPTLAPPGPHASGVTALSGGARGPNVPSSTPPRPSDRNHHCARDRVHRAGLSGCSVWVRPARSPQSDSGDLGGSILTPHGFSELNGETRTNGVMRGRSGGSGGRAAEGICPKAEWQYPSAETIRRSI
jgi:hypothetical protein